MRTVVGYPQAPQASPHRRCQADEARLALRLGLAKPDAFRAFVVQEKESFTILHRPTPLHQVDEL